MTIEKTYKLTIKDQAFFLSEEEVSNLYQQCRMVLNIKDLPTTNPVKPTIPYPYDTYPWYTPKYPNDTGYPYWTGSTTTCGTINAGEGNCVKDTNWQPNLCNTVKSSNGINFLSDDMETIKENDKWRSSVQKALDKLSAKTNVTTNDGTTIR
jgi:hypothetical protein